MEILADRQTGTDWHRHGSIYAYTNKKTQRRTDIQRHTQVHTDIQIKR